MKKLFKTLGKYARIELMFIRVNFLTQTQYRANFFFGFFMNVVWVFGKMIYAIISYTLDVPIGGLTPDEMLLFIGTSSIIMSIYCAFTLVGLQTMLPQAVQSGKLDLMLTKPISLQFYISLCYVEFPTMLGYMIGGIVMVAVALTRMAVSMSLSDILLYLLFILTSVSTVYGVTFLLQMLVFRHINTSAITSISSNSQEINTLPMLVYGKGIQLIFLFIIPIFLYGNIAPMFLCGRLEPMLAAWAILVPVLLFLIGRIIWKREIRHYSSASG